MPYLKRLLQILEVFAWTAFFVFAAAALVVRYWLLPDIERYRPQIEARVRAAVGQPVKIGAIEAGWDGLRPQISLSDVRIYDAQGREALVLPSVENIVSWRSLMHGEVRLRALRIQGPRLAVRRDAAGDVYVAGMKLTPGEGDTGFVDRLLGQEEVEVRNAEIEWRDEKRGAPPLVLTALDLRLRSEGDRHAVGLVARPPIELSTRLEVRAQLDGASLRHMSSWSGKVFAELGYTELAAWKAWYDYPFQIDRGQGAVRLWVDLDGGVVRHATADLQLAQIAASLGQGLAPFSLQGLEGRLQARRTPGGGYEISARALTLKPEGVAALPPLDFQLAWKADGGQLRANAVELEPLALIAESLPLPGEMRRLAAELAPRGQLADVHFDWQGDIAAPARYRGQARFSELGLRPRETLPGFSRLAGTLEVNEGGGRLNVQSRGAEIDLPRVFPEPRMVLDALSGQVEWKREEGTVTLHAPSISFSNADLSGNAFGSYVHAGAGPGMLDLSVAVSRADAKNLSHYLPLGSLMGEKTRAWLAEAVRAGQGSDVHVRLKGDLSEFPFAAGQGQFQVRAKVHKGLLRYAEGWPDISEIEGELLFERDRMDIAGRSGRILGAHVRDVHVSIDKLGPRATLLVTGGAEGPSAEFLRFLAVSPLRHGAGRFTGPIAAQGDGRLRLRLELPLADLAATRVSGEYEFADNRVTLQKDLAPFESARARLAFTQSSFTLRELRARLYGGTITASGGTTGSGRGGNTLEFKASGDAQPALLEGILDERLRAAFSGSAAYTATLAVREGVQRIVVESGLRGAASTLPPPFEKAAADTLPLRVDMFTSDAGARDRISIGVGRLAALELLRRREAAGMEVQRASLAFSPAAGVPLRLPERPGILVYGSVAALNADRWRELMGGGTGRAMPTALELKVARFDVYGRRFNNLALRGNADADGWTAAVDSDEAAGQVSYRNEGQGRFTARLLHLALAKQTPEQAAAPATRASSLPSIDFIAERMSLAGGQLGRVELKATHEGQDWRLENLAVTSSDATAVISGTWRDGTVPRSDISFDIDAYDAGRFMARLGYPGMLSGGKVQLDGTLAWQGNTLTPDYPTLGGELKLIAEEGEFLEIDPGLGKLVSLMNMQALPRRIALDFRDVFSKGFRFDRIDATARLERGVMDAREFRMRGPAAEVAMSGSVDLARETQKLKVRVVPSLGGSAATVVGIVNPLVGVAAAVAQAALKNPLGQIFAYEYDVTGGWADPKVVRLSAPPPAVINEAIKP